MAERIGTEASGLPLISAAHANPTCEGENPGHITINVESDVLNPQKSTFSEEQLKLSELEKADMSNVRKRSGMKVIFRVRRLRAHLFHCRRSRNALLLVIPQCTVVSVLLLAPLYGKAVVLMD